MPTPGLFDRVLTSPLVDLRQLDQYRFPALDNCGDLEALMPLLDRADDAGKYIVGRDPVCLFDRVIALTGMETALTAPYRDSARFELLLDHLTEITLQQIAAYGRSGRVQGFMTWQDFAGQESPMMSLELFDRFYRGRLMQMIKACHHWGMHFIWHCCGQIEQLIPKMITMGVDVVQLDQPALIGYRQLHDLCGGEVKGDRVCLWVALDTLWSTLHTCSGCEIEKEIQDMVTTLFSPVGGLMLRHYPQPADMGLTQFEQDAIATAFLSMA
jgi:hypothetical protein